MSSRDTPQELWDLYRKLYGYHEATIRYEKDYCDYVLKLINNAAEQLHVKTINKATETHD